MRNLRLNVKEYGGMMSSPYFVLFLLLLLLALILNLLVVVYPLVVEGILYRAPPPVATSLDSWFMKVLFGDFSPEQFELVIIGRFIPFLLEVYLLSFLTAVLVSMALLRKTTRELLKDRETTFSDKRLLRIFLDILVVGPFTLLAFDRILAFLIQYPLQLTSLGGSHLTLYFLTGFVTGSIIGKLLFPLRVRLECRRHNLELRATYIRKMDSNGRPTRWMEDRWVLMPTGSEKAGRAISERKQQ